VRVAIVAECFLPAQNGVTNSVVRITEQLERHRITSMVIAPGPGPTECGASRVERVPGLKLPFYRDLAVAMPGDQLRAALEAFEPDVVHLAAPAVLGMMAVRAARQLAVPVVAVYQTDYAGFARRYRASSVVPIVWRLLRELHTHADLTLAPSTSAVWQLQSRGIGSVALWGRGVDLDKFNPRHRSELLHRRLAPHGEVLVGYVGRLAHEKRVELLAHARMAGVRLVVIGDGPDKERLERKLGDAVFLGWRTGAELSQAIATLDVFVHTGADETFCQSVQEALAAAVPVVAPARGGPLDLVRHRENGYLYPPDDTHQLHGAVRQLVEGPAVRRQMSVAARRSVEGRGWDVLGEQLVAHYQQVLGRRARPRRVA
jgi:phosphatidylinositol alpha 1,6-mannosyltransferase